MGRTLTAKYQIRLNTVGPALMPMSWNCRTTGRPTEANIRKFVKGWEDSTLPGGVNAHLGVDVVLSAKILLNDGSGTVVAEYKREPIGGAMFETVTEYTQHLGGLLS